MNPMSSQQIPSPQIARRKQLLRAKMRAVRQELCPHHRVAQSHLIVTRIAQLMTHRAFKTAGLYLATQYEVNLDALVETWHAQDKEIYLPHLDDAQMPFHQFQSWQALESGALDLRQPDRDSPAILTATLDVMILPGLAFDANGNRLGHGGGWYDRQLESGESHQNVPLRIGVCYDEQFVDAVPHDRFDVRMTMVVTPSAIWEGGQRYSTEDGV